MSEGPWLAREAAGEAAKRHAPATLRNRDAIAEILAEELPASGEVLEIASGSGEHICYFAERLPALIWQPSDPDSAALASIAAWSAEAAMPNIRPPIELDAAASQWSAQRADALLCINMVHISPWAATLGLMAGAARLLPPGAPLILYGPFIEAEVPTAASNAEFDASLRARDARWGLRDTADVSAAAAALGFWLTRRCAMPANNLMLVYRPFDACSTGGA